MGTFFISARVLEDEVMVPYGKDIGGKIISTLEWISELIISICPLTKWTVTENIVFFYKNEVKHWIMQMNKKNIGIILRSGWRNINVLSSGFLTSKELNRWKKNVNEGICSFATFLPFFYQVSWITKIMGVWMYSKRLPLVQKSEDSCLCPVSHYHQGRDDSGGMIFFHNPSSLWPLPFQVPVFTLLFIMFTIYKCFAYFPS